MQEAIAADPRNPLARYEKASTLQAVGDMEGALAELQALTHIAPGEASVYFMASVWPCLGVLVSLWRVLKHRNLSKLSQANFAPYVS